MRHPKPSTCMHGFPNLSWKKSQEFQGFIEVSFYWIHSRAPVFQSPPRRHDIFSHEKPWFILPRTSILGGGVDPRFSINYLGGETSKVFFIFTLFSLGKILTPLSPYVIGQWFIGCITQNNRFLHCSSASPENKRLNDLNTSAYLLRNMTLGEPAFRFWRCSSLENH